MDNNTIKHIEKFIEEIEDKYEGIIINYHYDAEEDLYLIYHNNNDLQYNKSQFLDFVGGLLRSHIIDKGIFNISFGYDYDFDVRLKIKSNQESTVT